jgi:hypothetical protein
LRHPGRPQGATACSGTPASLSESDVRLPVSRVRPPRTALRGVARPSRSPRFRPMTPGQCRTRRLSHGPVSQHQCACILDTAALLTRCPVRSWGQRTQCRGRRGCAGMPLPLRPEPHRFGCAGSGSAARLRGGQSSSYDETPHILVSSISRTRRWGGQVD